MLALAENDLIVAVAGPRASEARRFSAAFDPEAACRSLAGRRIEALCPHADGYPTTLLALADVPPVLYLAGGADRLLELTRAPVVTVVGTRTPSRYATEVAYDLGRGLAAAGVTVVSGLAMGIDAAAHRGALAGGGRPIGVLAGGVDISYPKVNRALHAQVAEAGVLVSELPPGLRPLRWSFPARNRIMAALGRLVVVVEAAESSGTLITAEFATQLGREVGAVPGQVTARLSAGSNRLLREGAALIRSPQDALDELLGVGSAGAVGASTDGPWRRAARARAAAESRRAECVMAARRRAGPARRGARTLAPPRTRPGREWRACRCHRARDRPRAGPRQGGARPARAMGLIGRDGFAGYFRALGAPPLGRPILDDLVSGDAPT